MVVVLGRVVVLGLVITAGFLVVVVGADVLDCTNNVVVFASLYFFVIPDVLGGKVDEDANKSIIMDSEDDSNDGKSLIALTFLFEFAVLIAFDARVSPGLASASSKIYKKYKYVI